MKVFITDTTLREGIQSPSLELSFEERKELFFKIAATGVYEIEAGVPAHSQEERDYIKELVSSPYGDRVIVWNRASVKDILHSLDCNAKKLEIAFPVSDIMIEKKLRKDRDYILALARDIVEFTKRNGCFVSIGMEDVSRADFKFVMKFVEKVRCHGADRVRLSDTVGVLNPVKVAKITRKISSLIDVEVHFHNDFGMATANAVTAANFGAKYINTTLLGLGERCGITPAEEIVLYLKMFDDFEVSVDVDKLVGLIDWLVDKYKIEINPNKPLIGKNAFTSKSSIHIDGLKKSRQTYLPFDPQVLGRKEEFIYGEYS